MYAANRNSDVHAPALRFLEQCAQREEPLCLTWSAVNAFLRLSTSPKVLSAPLTPREAREWVADLLDQPPVRMISEEPGFWRLYVEVSTPLNPRGAAVTDTHLATVLLQHGVKTFYTRDRDFRRYDFLKIVDPIG